VSSNLTPSASSTSAGIHQHPLHHHLASEMSAVFSSYASLASVDMRSRSDINVGVWVGDENTALARQINKLSALGVTRATKPGRHSDGGGLYLQVSPSGAKSWLFLYRQGKRLREMGLGGLIDITLAEARKKAADCRRAVKEGDDPIEKRRAEKEAKARAKQEAVARAKTFGEFAKEYIATHETGWRNAKHRQQWRNTLGTYAKPLLEMPIALITTEHVLTVLKPIWLEKPETASRLRGRIEQILDAAKAAKFRTGDNPAEWKGNLKHLLSKRDKASPGHHAALPYDDVPAFIQTLREQTGVGSLALEFSILTATRTSETLGAKWNEIDREKRVWTVPVERMKAGELHEVPLSARALEILGEARTLGIGEYVFPGRNPKRPLSNMVFLMLLRRIGRDDLTAHGFRSSFRDWAGDKTTFPREIAEMSLAHKVGNEVEAAYRRENRFGEAPEAHGGLG
jgi:integrase